MLKGQNLLKIEFILRHELLKQLFFLIFYIGNKFVGFHETIFRQIHDPNQSIKHLFNILESFFLSFLLSNSILLGFDPLLPYFLRPHSSLLLDLTLRRVALFSFQSINILELSKLTDLE